ncbi:sulfite oxidase-like oxidoreductase [Synechococcus sp. PCC 7336]|uniref:sulfite oxidase-like oxidoreductase n=1 Tax=Synechococcus sp. PCC 7336 TaxID=195250 RepID=UPI00034563B2|nr:sulfite oxidase-like oxidoreductase [Synechococcus sp. PCC 7336]
MIGKFFQKVTPDTPNRDRVPPGQHLAQGFPVLTYGPTPSVTPQAWQLRIYGAIEGEEAIVNYDELLAMPQETFAADFHCVTRWSKLDVTWTGVKLTELLELVQISPKANYVMQHCYSDYTTNLSLADFLREENYIVHRLEGEPLPAEHGGPVRTLVPHLYAWKSAKWINAIEFLTEEQLGFWERNGYHRRGEPFAEERYSR